MNDHEIRELVKSELPYPQLTDRANIAFEKAYLALRPCAERGDARRQASEEGWKEEAVFSKARKHRGLRTMAVSLSSVAAAFLFLVLLNSAFPALAESIPGLGGIFRTLNYKFGLGSNLPTYENLIQPVNVTSGSKSCEITVREAYSEGENIFLSLQLKSADEGINSAKWLSTVYHYDEALEGYRKEYSAAVNGEQAEMTKEIIFTKEGEIFECAAVIRLPHEAAEGEKLHVELQIDALRGLREGTVMRAYPNETTPEVEITEPVLLSFDVTADTSRNTQGEAGVTVDSVAFESYESTPSCFRATLSYPCIGGVVYDFPDFGWVEAHTEDGTLLDRVSGKDGASPSAEELSVGDTVTHTASFSGVPEGTRQVIITLYNNQPRGESIGDWVDGGVIGSCVFAEFTLDLETGEAAATENYVEEGYERLPIQEYLEILKAGPEFQNHVFLPTASFGYGRLTGPDEEYVEEEMQGEWTVSFYADTEEPLPLEVEFHWGDEIALTIPLQEQEDSIPTDTGYRTLREEWGVNVDNCVLEKEQFGLGYVDSIKREYTACFYLNREQSLKQHFWHYGDPELMSYRILNAETGEVVFDHENYERPIHYIRPQDLEE